ncbi:class III lanthipeptide [Streptomyces sp. IBSBF 2435]
MSVLKLQVLEPTAVHNAVAILSTTSSSSDCCKSNPK